MFEGIMLLSIAAFLYALDGHLQKKRAQKIVKQMRERGISEDTIFIAENWMK